MRVVPLFAAVVLLPAAMAAAFEIPSFYREIERAVVRREPARLAEHREVLRREARPMGEGVLDLRAYTLAYVNSRLSPILPESRRNERFRLLQEAQAALQGSLRQNPGDAESQALLGAIYGAQISLSPIRAITLGPRVAAAFAEAEKLAPANPRVALQKGISLLFVPRAFGGGPESAEKELRRAETLFAQEPAAKPWPNWGRLDVLAWLGQVRARQGDPAGARTFYRQALALDPGYVWASLLLDQLDRR
jgi:tetratricopeptide (TPR) repeat protein